MALLQLLLRPLGTALAAGLCWGGGTACSPAGEAPALEQVPAEEAPAPEAARPDPLARYLALPTPGPAEADQILDSLEAALADWRDAEEAHEVEAAARRVDRSLEALPTLADWRPLVRAELLAKAGDTAAVRASLDELDPLIPLGERWGWRFLVQAYDEADDLSGARSVAEAVAAAEVSEATTASAWLRAGELALEAPDTAAATAAFRRALGTDSESASGRAAARALDRLVPEGDREENLAVGRALLAARDWNRAHRRLAAFLDDPELPEVEEARIRLGLGQALVELGRFQEAREVLASLTGEAVPGALAAPALYWTGRAALGAGRTADAETAFRRLGRRAPGSSLAEAGLLLLLDREATDRPTLRTLELLEELFQVGVSSSAGELVAVRIGAGKYLRGEYDAAATTFASYIQGSGRAPTRQQAAYWAALAQERSGNVEEANVLLRQAHAQNPLSFYGVFAGERLGEPVLREGIPEGPAPVPGLEGELANALLRLQVHRLVPTAGSFAFELERLTEHFFQRGDGAYDFAEALIEGAFSLQGIVLGREIHRREGEWNLRLLRIVHPFPYREVIVQEARSRGLDPFFVAGLIRQESMFDRGIRSPAGAVGLMQLMPATAREVARSAGIRYSPESLTDPRTNVRLGTMFLASMVNRYGGRAEDALSAYNAGPSRINQWRQRPEHRDRDVFIEHIPFQETRNYVKVVQQYARIYTALYGCPGFQPCLGLSYPAAVARSPYGGGAPNTAVAR